MTSSWIWIGAALLGLLSLAHSRVQEEETCRIPANTCSLKDGDAEEDIDGMFEVDGSEFPAEEFAEDMKKLPTMKAVYDANINAVSAEKTASISTYPHYDWHWGLVCPHIHYHVWLWGLWHPSYGICYVMSHIHATRCTTHYCRHIVHWIDALFYHYRCFQRYRRVYVWLWCPWSHTFFVYSRWIPSSCDCHRYMCHAQLAYPGEAIRKDDDAP